LRFVLSFFFLPPHPGVDLLDKPAGRFYVTTPEEVVFSRVVCGKLVGYLLFSLGLALFVTGEYVHRKTAVSVETGSGRWSFPTLFCPFFSSSRLSTCGRVIYCQRRRTALLRYQFTDVS